MTKGAWAAALGGVVLLTVPVLARAATTVTVKLEDMTVPGVKTMKIVPSVHPVKPGAITFHVTNESKYLIHELLVIKPPPSGKLPFDNKADAIIEQKTDKLEDSGDLKPGTSVATHVTLAPGKYLLVCNEPGHYKAGMWTWLHVKK